MINKKVDDAIFEVILTHAFREAFAQEMEQIEAEDSQPAQPSENYRKQEQRYYKKMQRKPVKSVTILRVVAACAAVYIGLSSGLILFSPPVRAAVVDTVVGFFEKYVTVDVSDTDVLVIDGYTFAYVPKGYELTDKIETTLVTRYKFSNGSEYYRVCVYAEYQHQLKYDIEQGDTEIIRINSSDAYLIQSEEGFYSIIWTLNEKSIVIEGNVAPNIMKKIAENFS